MYDIAFRLSVVRYYNKYINVSTNTIADIEYIFGISHGSIYNWINMYKLNASVDPKQIGRPIKSRKITDLIERYIIKRFTVNKKNNIKNLRRSIMRVFNISISRSSIYGVLHRNKLSYKKVTVSKSPFSSIEIKQKKEKMRKDLNIKIKDDGKFNHDNVISVDESFMSPETLKKEYEWSLKGKRVYRKINGKKSRIGKSMLLAIGNKKTEGCKTIKGPVNGEMFYNFLVNEVIKDRTGMLILLDNARIHHYGKLKKKIEETGNKLVYNIPYHPESNPVEYLNNVVKSKLKNQYVENVDNLDIKLTEIIKKIPEIIYENCFNHAYKCITTD